MKRFWNTKNHIYDLANEVLWWEKIIILKFEL